MGQEEQQIRHCMGEKKLQNIAIEIIQNETHREKIGEKKKKTQSISKKWDNFSWHKICHLKPLRVWGGWREKLIEEIWLEFFQILSELLNP